MELDNCILENVYKNDVKNRTDDDYNDNTIKHKFQGCEIFSSPIVLFIIIKYIGIFFRYLHPYCKQV